MGPLNINSLSNGLWECPTNAEVSKIFEKYKKVDHEKLYHSFVCAVLDDYLDPRWICHSDVLPQRQNTQGPLSIFLCIFEINLYPLLKKRMFLLSIEHAERLIISADWFFFN